MARCAISATCSGARSTTTIRAILINSPSPKRSPDGAARILVAIADVDAVVKKGTAARRSCAAKYDFGLHGGTSLSHAAGKTLHRPHFAQFRFRPPRHRGGYDVSPLMASCRTRTIYEATVRNQAKLAYNSTAAWLDGTGPMPPEIAAVKGSGRKSPAARLDRTEAQALRHQQGALDLEDHRSACGVSRMT